jgi:hypothetical protein
MATTLQQWLDQTLAVIVLYKTPLQEAVAFRLLRAPSKTSGKGIISLSGFSWATVYG